MPSCVKVTPPWEFLLSASRNSLQNYELSRLSHAANLRKEIAALVDLWVEENSAAMLARWLMEHRERESTASASEQVANPAAAPTTPNAAQPPAQRNAVAASVSDNFLPEFVTGRSTYHGRP